MIRVVVLSLVLASFSWAELMPDVADDACNLPDDVALSRDRFTGADVDARRDAMTLEISDYDHDKSCKETAACAKRPISQSRGQGDFYKVITYSF